MVMGDAADENNWDVTFRFFIEVLQRLRRLRVSEIYGKYAYTKLAFHMSSMLGSSGMVFGKTRDGDLSRKIVAWFARHFPGSDYVAQTTKNFANVKAQLYTENSHAPLLCAWNCRQQRHGRGPFRAEHPCHAQVGNALSYELIPRRPMARRECKQCVY